MAKKHSSILITGGAGYVGSLLTQALLMFKHHVIIVDSLLFGNQSLTDIESHIDLHVIDYRDITQEMLEQAHTVVHLAGISTEPTSQYDPRKTDLVNHIGTVALARKAKQAGVSKFIFASSCSVYFSFDTHLIPRAYTETDQLNPISAYSLSKRAAELGLLELQDKLFAPVILRKGTIYGLSPRVRYDLVLNSFVKDALTKQKMYVHGNGQIYRPMLDIMDAVNAYTSVINAPGHFVSGQIYNVVTENWNILELAKRVQSIIPVEIVIEPTGIVRNYFANGDKFRNALNCPSTRGIETAIYELERYIRNHLQQVNDPFYYNDKAFFIGKDSAK